MSENKPDLLGHTPRPAVADVELAFTSTRAIEIGTAAEHIVAADLLLAGHRAFMVAAGLPYDLILDHKGMLYRVGVKSTMKCARRPGRLGSSSRYLFSATRTKRDNTGKTHARPYTKSEIDIMAFVALDIRRVAYVSVTGPFATGWHFDAPDGIDDRTTIFGPKNYASRKRFSDFPLAAAISILETDHGR